jgi:hypothetical protein
MNAMPPFGPDHPLSITFTLPAQDWNLVIELLTRAPYYIAAPMIAAVHEQARRAPLDDAIRATEAGASIASDDPGPVSEDMPPHPTDLG